MNLKLHFLDSHLDYFPCNLDDFIEGERFHKDIKGDETRYQGRWDTNIKHKRKSHRRSFEDKKTSKET